MNMSRLDWYRRRLQRMSVREVGWRLSDYARQRTWKRYQVRPGTLGPSFPVFTPHAIRRRVSDERAGGGGRRFVATLPEGALAAVPIEARDAVMVAADEILAGRWTVLGVPRHDIDEPDWFFDPVTGKRAPQEQYCFSIDHRDVQVTGNVKQVWELSRFHHVTVLAAAFAFSRNEKYAERAAAQLRSWWAQNQALTGVHWTSGIEIGLRLISWVWVRRLLDGWEGVTGLFEDNDEAVTQIWWHQHYLATFQSRGSSANNHVIAESAGQLVAALAFNWFEDSPKWAARAAALLDAEVVNNTFPSGVNREMAFDYHGFVAELGLLAAAEAERAGHPLSSRLWEQLGSMVDVIASVVDAVTLRPPARRQRRRPGSGARATGRQPVGHSVGVGLGRIRRGRLVARLPAGCHELAGRIDSRIPSAEGTSAVQAGPLR